MNDHSIHELERVQLVQLVESLWLYESDFTDWESRFVDDMSRELSEGVDLTYDQRESLWQICQKVGVDV